MLEIFRSKTTGKTKFLIRKRYKRFKRQKGSFDNLDYCTSVSIPFFILHPLLYPYICALDSIPDSTLTVSLSMYIFPCIPDCNLTL